MKLRRALWVAVAAVATIARAQEAPSHHDHDATMHHRFEDAEQWAKVFVDPARDAWQKPDAVIAWLGVKDGQTVADLGAGTGYFTMRLSKAVGAKGRVLAIDIEPTLVAHIEERAKGAGLGNVAAVLAAPDDPKIAPGTADLVLIVDTWHHIDARDVYLKKLRAALSPGGRVAIVDFKPGDLPVGPPPEHRLPREAIETEFREGGWRLAASSAELLPYQFVLVFAPE